MRLAMNPPIFSLASAAVGAEGEGGEGEGGAPQEDGGGE